MSGVDLRPLRRARPVRRSREDGVRRGLLSHLLRQHQYVIMPDTHHRGPTPVEIDFRKQDSDGRTVLYNTDVDEEDQWIVGYGFALSKIR